MTRRDATHCGSSSGCSERSALSCNKMQYDATRRDALRQVERLLGKELVGAPAVGVEQLAPRSAVPDGELQDMAVQRLDSREQKRREFYNKKR